MEESYSVTISSLTCQEDQSLFDDDDDEIEEKRGIAFILDDPFLSETEEEYIEILISKESSSERRHCGFFYGEDWLIWARVNAIQWITKTCAYFSFGSQTAYLAITYFDRFLTRRSIDKGKSWVVQLLSVACLSLAAKMEECAVPPTSDYHVEECCFDGNAIQRMELLILSTLEWRMSSVTPFSFLKFFLDKLRVEDRSNKSVSLAIGFIFAVVGDINLVEYQPSAIAASAALAASNQRLTKKLVEAELCVFSSCATLDTEQVLSCYSLMTRDSLRLSSVTSDSLISSETSTNFSSTNSNKRRRLRLGT